jgi:BlaI family penicillinase repressor
MNDHSTQVPTDAELEILQVLWANQPQSVRFVNDTINGRRDAAQQVGYTTTLKQMQVMLDKGLLTREIIERNHLYCAAQSRETTQTQVVREVAMLAFDGSASSLVMRALGSGETSPEELEAIKALISQIEAQQKQQD